MENIVEGLILPIIFIIIVTIGAIIGIIASVETDNIDNNQAFSMEDELVRANRYLVIGYILYFVSIALIIVSLITQFSWKDAPAWLQTFLILIAFVIILIGLILNWIAYDNLRNIEDDVKDHTLWALSLGLVGLILAIILLFFRGASYVREHTINTVKEIQQETKPEPSDLERSTPITTQTKYPDQTVTTTSRSFARNIVSEKPPSEKSPTEFPMMI